MLECKYVAGFPKKGRSEFVFQTANNRINNSDIRDYSWEYDERFNKVRGFSKGLTTRKIPVFFYQRMSATDKNEMCTSAETMYEIFDRDVRAQKMGTLYIGDFWINCYIIASEKKQYNNGVIIEEEITLLSDFTWHKTVKRVFGVSSGGGGGQDYDFLDFSYDFEYDYGSAYGSNDTRFLASEAIAPFNFRIEFTGPVENPTLIVGGQTYRVFTSVLQDEVLIVDSIEKRVYRHRPDGVDVNEFDNRDRDYYIFEPMPAEGDDTLVVWQEGHIVTLYAYIERSEPKWI